MTTLGVLPGPEEPPLRAWPGDYRRIHGRRTFVREAGRSSAGEVAVYVHGLGGASTNWTDLMALLGTELHGFAPDLPGFGYSDPPVDGRYPLDLHVATVAALIRDLAVGPVHLFGNSLGGATATRLAARYPELVRTLTLISPALPDLRPRSGIDWRLPLMFLPGIGPKVQQRMGAAPPEARVRGLLALVMAPGNTVAAEREAEMLTEVRRRDELGYGDQALVRSLRGLVGAQAPLPKQRNLWRDAALVAAPTLLVWGRHDRLVDVGVSARAVRVFRDADLLVLDDAGHVAQIERPEAVAKAWRGRFRTQAV